MKVDIDLEGVLKSAQELPNEVSRVDDVHSDLQEFYRQDGEKLRLDTSRRDEFVSHLSSRLESYNLQQENAKLKDERNRRQVVEVVKSQLSRFVKPELMPAAVALFISQHKFSLKDGGVIVIGKVGTADAEISAIKWINDEGFAFKTTKTQSNADSGFSAQINSLKDKFH
ncbi:hypothetical protein [Agrobacterium sp. MCAB5]|uniref:hypothetical protein n=1 Tax=Agrobacterium sp. MCAB5 TaxID=3233042 RepID=UPI003F93116A